MCAVQLVCCGVCGDVSYCVFVREGESCCVQSSVVNGRVERKKGQPYMNVPGKKNKHTETFPNVPGG